MKTNTLILLMVLPTLMSLILGTASALPVKEDLGQYVISFNTSLIDKVKVLPVEKDETNSGLNYQSYGLELYDYLGINLGKIIVTQFAGKSTDKESDTRKKELASTIRDQGCTRITNRDITIDGRSGIIVACESNNFFLFESRISSKTIVHGFIYLPWSDNTKDVIDSIHVQNRV